MIQSLFRYYAGALVLGVAVILVSGSSFVLKSPVGYGLSDRDYGSLFLFMVVPAVLATSFFKRLLDRFGVAGIYRAGAVFCALFCLLMFCGARWLGGVSYPWFALAQVWLGAGFGLFLSSLSVLAVDAAPRHASAALAGLHMVFGLGAASAPLWIMGFKALGIWEVVFLFVTTGFVAAFFLGPKSCAGHSDAVLKKPAESAVSQSAGALPLRAHAFFALAFGYGIAESLIANWSVPYLTEVRGFTADRAAICLSVFWGSLTAGRLFAAIWSMRHDPRRIQRISPWVMTAGIAAAALWRDESTVWLAYLWTGLGCSYFFPVTVSLATLYHTPWKNFLAGYLLAGIMTGVGVGSTATGALKEAGLLSLPAAFALASAIAALLGLGSFFLLKQPLPASQNNPISS